MKVSAPAIARPLLPSVSAIRLPDHKACGTLGLVDRAGRQIEGDEIGECSADVECNYERQRVVLESTRESPLALFCKNGP